MGEALGRSGCSSRETWRSYICSVVTQCAICYFSSRDIKGRGHLLIPDCVEYSTEVRGRSTLSAVMWKRHLGESTIEARSEYVAINRRVELIPRP